MEFQKTEIMYYAVLWGITFVAGVVRTIRDHDYESSWDVLAVGAVGGFWGFVVVGVCTHFGPSISDFGWAYLAVSAGIGLVGKEQERLMRRLLRGAIEKLTGIDIERIDDSDFDELPTEQDEQPEKRK